MKFCGAKFADRQLGTCFSYKITSSHTALSTMLFHSLFKPLFPQELGKAGLRCLETSHDSHQTLVNFLALHHSVTKPCWRCHHATWYLVDLWAPFLWVQPPTRAPISTFRVAFCSPGQTICSDDKQDVLEYRGTTYSYFDFSLKPAISVALPTP